MFVDYAYASVVSSANKMTSECFRHDGKSFMYIRNSRGPRTEPCGTPQSISRTLDCVP